MIALHLGFNTAHPQLSPVESVGLCDCSVQTTGCAVTDQLEQKHHAVIRVLGNRQVDTFPRLGGNLDDWIAYPELRRTEETVADQILLGGVAYMLQHKNAFLLMQQRALYSSCLQEHTC